MRHDARQLEMDRLSKRDDTSELDQLIHDSGQLFSLDKKGGIANLISSIVGSAVLVLPLVVFQCGLLLGLVLLILSAILHGFTLTLLCDTGRHIRETDPSYEERLIAYPIVGGIAYPKWGKMVSQVVILIYTYTVILGFFIVCGDVIPDIIKFFTAADKEGNFIESRECGTLIFLIIGFPFCFYTKITKLQFVAAGGCFAEAWLILVVFIRAVQGLSSPDYPDNLPPGDIVLLNPSLQIFRGLSIITFAYVTHPVMLPIFSELRPKYWRSSRATFDIVAASVGISCFLYCVAGAFGYVQFRSETPGNLLLGFRSDDVLVLSGRVGLVMMIFISLAVTHFPCRRALIVAIWGDPHIKGWRSAACTVVIVVSAFVLSLVFQQIGQIASLSGALCGSLIGIVFPPLFWLKIVRNNEFFGDYKAICATCLIPLGFGMLVIGTQQSVADFIDDPPKF